MPNEEREYDIVDPLGELRRFAKELWSREGKPEGSTWQDYFSRAEEVVLGAGVSLEDRKKRTPRIFLPPKKKEKSPYIAGLIEQKNDPLLSLCASVFGREIDEHESFCLSVVLENNKIVLGEGGEVAPASRARIASILAALVGVYPKEFTTSFDVDSFFEIPFRARIDYWMENLEALSIKDEPLNYCDLNTICRIESVVKENANVTCVKLVSSHSSLF